MNLPFFRKKPETFDVSSVKFKKPINEQLMNKLTYCIQSFYKDASKLGLSKIMVRINGEINSLTAATILNQTLKENVIAMIFDFEANTNHLVEICQKLSLNTYILKRSAAYQAETATYRFHKQVDIRNFYKRFINFRGLKVRGFLLSSLQEQQKTLPCYSTGLSAEDCNHFSIHPPL